MNTETNKAITGIPATWEEVSGRYSGLLVTCPTGTTICIDHIPTILVNRLIVAVSSDTTGDLVLRKWYAGGTLFVDETFAIIGGISETDFSETLLETCQILFTHVAVPDASVTVSEIGRH